MYADLNDLDKLDAGLEYFMNVKNPSFSQLFDVKSALDIPDSKMLFELLQKLEKDGYIHLDLNPIEGKEDKSISYRSTFDGRLFYNKGGYNFKALKDANDALLIQIEIDRRKELDVLSIDRSTRLNVLTNSLAWATWFAFAVGFLLLIWQILQFFLLKKY